MSQVLAPAGAVAAFESEHDGESGPDAGYRVADVVADHLRSSHGGAGDGHPAAHALDAWVVGGPVGVGAGGGPLRVAVAGEAGIDEARIDFAEPVVAQPKAAQSAGAPIVKEYVGPGDHALECLLAERVAKVDGDAFLVAVEAEVAGADPLSVGAVDEWAVGATALANSGAFDLYDLGTHVGQDHGAERPRHYVGYVEDAQPVQREGYGPGFAGHCYPSPP